MLFGDVFNNYLTIPAAAPFPAAHKLSSVAKIFGAS
jgi:hypothetical protein